MNAADVPEARADGGPLVMAARLVTYLDDPHIVRSAIRAEYGHAPDLRTIKAMRAKYVKNRDKPQPAPCACDAWKRQDEAENAYEINKEFVWRLERERSYSVSLALSNGALHHPFLTRQYLVDNAFEREVAAARKVVR